MKVVSFVAGVSAAVAFSATLVFATESRLVSWGDLVGQEAQTYEDPYLDLSYDQLEKLREISVETRKIGDGGLNGEAKALSAARISDAKELLAEDGIDADWLIAQRWLVAERRKKAANAANPALDGQTVTLAGFAVAAPPDEDGMHIVYLVPERGMCSHMPPPNANQMIRARVTSDWIPSTMHEPVRLTGTLSVAGTKHTFSIVDGVVPMHSSYILDVTEVETAPVFRTQPKVKTEWATSGADGFRVPGQLPNQTKKPEE